MIMSSIRWYDKDENIISLHLFIEIVGSKSENLILRDISLNKDISITA